MNTKMVTATLLVAIFLMSAMAVMAPTVSAVTPNVVSVDVGSQTGTLTSGTAGSVTYSVTVTGHKGFFSFWVDLTITTTLPTGTTYSFAPSSLHFTLNGDSDKTSTLTITTTSGTPAGVTDFTVKAQQQGDPGDFKTDDGTLTVNGPPSPPQADLSIAKTADKTMAHIGDEVTYTYTVTNAGTDTATNVEVYDDVVDETWTRGELVASGTWEFTAAYTVLGTDSDPLVNTATVSSSTEDPNPENNEASWSIDILHPDIDVAKTADKTMAHVGDTIVYTVTITNPSTDTTMTLVSVSDSLLGDMSGDFPGTMAPTSSETSTFDYIVPISSGEEVVNTVTVIYADALDQEVTDTASWSVDILKPAINVLKTADKTAAYVGDTIVYTYILINCGNTPLSSVTVVDDKAADVSYVNGDTNEDGYLDMTEIWTYTASYIILETDPDPLVNTVTASGTNGLGVVSDTDSWTVDILPTPEEPQPQPTGGAGGGYSPEQIQAIVNATAILNGAGMDYNGDGVVNATDAWDLLVDAGVLSEPGFTWSQEIIDMHLPVLQSIYGQHLEYFPSVEGRVWLMHMLGIT